MSYVTPSNGENPLGTQRITSLIAKYSLPTIISGVVSALYNMVDQVFIGWGVGEVGIAATNVAFPFFTICAALALLLGNGGASAVSLALGRGKNEDARKIACNSLGMLAITGIIVGAVCVIFLDPLLRSFGTTDTVLVYARPYSLIVAFGFPCHIFSMGASHIIRADGKPTPAMICTASGAVFNLIADPLFMFGFGMGVEGVALATTLAQVVSTIFAFYYLLCKPNAVLIKWRYLRLKMDVVRAFSAIGAPGCVNRLAMAVVQITTNKTMVQCPRMEATSPWLLLAQSQSYRRYFL